MEDQVSQQHPKVEQAQHGKRAADWGRDVDAKTRLLRSLLDPLPCSLGVGMKRHCHTFSLHCLVDNTQQDGGELGVGSELFNEGVCHGLGGRRR
jgi:hypothetical protein